MLSDLALEDREKPEESGRHVAQIATRAREGIRSLDEIVWAVNPSNDTLNHLVDYIGQSAVDFLGTSRIRCFVDLPEELPDCTVSSEVRHHLFLVVKETLNNIVRHARATEVRISAAVSAGWLEIHLEDNGQGFDGTSANPYADGLRNMTERMRAIGGEFQVETAPGSGTRVWLRLKLSGPAGPETIGSRTGPGCG
jgi:signal transduction histidine kinase